MSTDFGQLPTHHGDPAYQAALERAEMLQGYYIHLLVYVAVNTGLFFINLFTRGGDGDRSPTRGRRLDNAEGVPGPASRRLPGRGGGRAGA